VKYLDRYLLGRAVELAKKCYQVILEKIDEAKGKICGSSPNFPASNLTNG